MYRFGRILIAMLPMIIAIVLQNVCSMFFMIADAMKGIDITNAINDTAYMASLTVKTINAYALIGIAIFATWYLVGARTTRYEKEKPLITLKTIPAMIFLAAATQILVSCALEFLAVYFPKVIDAYNAGLEESGIGQWNLLSFSCTVLLAPVVEEFVFRGMTIHFLKKAGLGFYLVNLIQAIIFGAFHFNLVQGVYAAFIGLLLGYLYYKYNSMLIPIVVHILVNLAGTLLNRFYEYIPEAINTLPILTAIGAGVFLIGFLMVMFDKARIDLQGYDY